MNWLAAGVEKHPESKVVNEEVNTFAKFLITLTLLEQLPPDTNEEFYQKKGNRSWWKLSNLLNT